jgi:hypothetical protein
MDVEEKKSVLENPGELEKEGGEEIEITPPKKRDHLRHGNKSGSYMRRDRRNSKSRKNNKAD